MSISHATTALVFMLARPAIAMPAPDAEVVYPLADVVVTAARTPLPADELPRSVTVIDRAEIAASPAADLADLLSDAVGMDVRSRGPFGTQSDVAMRGGTFEQTLVLVDGIKVNSPQTGHHTLDIPVNLADIERIEIVRGAASRLYGPNAFGGVVNIITRPAVSRTAEAHVGGGQHALSDVGGSASYYTGKTGVRASGSYVRSDGHRDGAEFDIKSATAGATLEVGPATVDLSGGWRKSDVGAYAFYSAAYPDEWEGTSSGHLSVRAATNVKAVNLAASAAWQRHNDDFILDRSQPDWYRNKHTTDVVTGRAQADFPWVAGTFAFGGEVGNERIESSSLGDHDRNRAGLFAEQQFGAQTDLSLIVGTSAYYYSEVGWLFAPGVDIGAPVTRHSRIYVSVGRAFRVPTYTDLYYVSPANVGNPELKHEESWTYEAGWRRTGRMLSAQFSVFRRDATNLIDWSRESDADPWQAQNVAHVITDGFESEVRVHPTGTPVTSVRAGYAFLNSEEQGGRSKYALNYLRHQFVGGIAHALPWEMSASWTLTVERRSAGGTVPLLDARIERRFGAYTISMGGTNLLDRSYVDAGFVPQPGRWIRAGLAYSFGR